MSEQPHVPLVIGVFGGDTSDVAIDFANHVGAAVARDGRILLTGGEGPSRTVKQQARLGAGAAGGTRVDVNPQATQGLRFCCGRNFAAFDTDLADKRNYLEACICDVAIALAGGPGTRSEVTFCLSLQKPVLFVGDHWKTEYPLNASPPHVSRGCVAEAFQRARKNPKASRALDRVMSVQKVVSGLEKLPAVGNHPLPGPLDVPDTVAVEVVRKVVALLPAGTEPTRGSGIPAVGDYAIMREQYIQWLNAVEQRLTR